MATCVLGTPEAADRERQGGKSRGADALSHRQRPRSATAWRRDGRVDREAREVGDRPADATLVAQAGGRGALAQRPEADAVEVQDQLADHDSASRLHNAPE